jgi:hypothetical protein
MLIAMIDADKELMLVKIGHRQMTTLGELRNSLGAIPAISRNS